MALVVKVVSHWASPASTSPSHVGVTVANVRPRSTTLLDHPDRRIRRSMTKVAVSGIDLPRDTRRVGPNLLRCIGQRRESEVSC